jgi:nitric oxide reductase subunit B
MHRRFLTGVGPSGEVFTRWDIAGARSFLKYGLMKTAPSGHGAYLGRDFSAEYLHTLALDANETLAEQEYGKSWQELSSFEQQAVSGEVQKMLKENRYQAQTKTLTFSQAEVDSFQNQVGRWTNYFADPTLNGGLPAEYIKDSEELRLTAGQLASAAAGLGYSTPTTSFDGIQYCGHVSDY